jgi:hypothetical protein
VERTDAAPTTWEIVVFSSPTLPSRRTWRAASRAILGALIVGLYGAQRACGQPPTTLVPLTVEPKKPSSASKFTMDGKYDWPEYSSFVVEKNDGKDNFIGELKSALYELAHREFQIPTDEKPLRYVVTRVTAPPGYGKSALLRYINDILLKRAKTSGSSPEAFRGTLKFDVHFHEDRLPAPEKKHWGQIHAAEEKGTLRIRVYDWDGHHPNDDTLLPINADTCQLAEQIMLWKPSAGKPPCEDVRDKIIRGVGKIMEQNSAAPSLAPFDVENHIFKINLDRLATQPEIRSTLLDELKNDDGFPAPPFARLPAFDYDRHASPGIKFLVNAFNPRPSEPDFRRSILFIDSLDEIHPESATSLLTRLDEYIKAREDDDKRGSDEQGFLRVFVFGRPEGFQDYYRITQGGVYKTPPIKLLGPDLMREGVCAQQAAAASVVRFVLGDEDGKRETEIENMVRGTFCFLTEHPWLEESESLENLSAFNDLVKISERYQENPGQADDFMLKETLFQSLLARARASHNRPTWQTDRYVELFEMIASWHRQKLGDCFDVAPSESVEIGIAINGSTHKLTYLVESVLNRSGIAELDSPVFNVPRYRFYPKWVHGHLIERRRMRLTGNLPSSR